MVIKGKTTPSRTDKTPYFPGFQVMFLAIILLLLLPLSHLQAQHPEYQVKSYLLSRISNLYIEWPREVGIDDPDKPFIIAVFGDNSFVTYLKQVYGGKQKPTKIKNKTVELRYIKDIEESADCHILFVSELNRRMLSKVVEFTQDRPILTIADTEGYCRRGIHINFVLENTANSAVKSQQNTERKFPNIGLEINESAIRQSGLLVSDELLKNATEIIEPFKPYEEKANKLAPITTFITWPPGTDMNDPAKPLKIEILGENDYDSNLEKIYKKKKLKNKPVVIHTISKVKEISNPHILIISKSMKDKISEIISYTKNKPILTIGDTNGFQQAGVHINFYYDRLKLCLEINEQAAKAAGLSISYHLLKMAKLRESF